MTETTMIGVVIKEGTIINAVVAVEVIAIDDY